MWWTSEQLVLYTEGLADRPRPLRLPQPAQGLDSASPNWLPGTCCGKAIAFRNYFLPTLWESGPEV